MANVASHEEGNIPPQFVITNIVVLKQTNGYRTKCIDNPALFIQYYSKQTKTIQQSTNYLQMYIKSS